MRLLRAGVVATAGLLAAGATAEAAEFRLRLDIGHPQRHHRGYGHAYHYGFERGVDDGREKGWSDARRHRAFDPWRHRSFRRAGSGYRGHYGSRDVYGDGYREGFMRGYRRAFDAYVASSYDRHHRQRRALRRYDDDRYDYYDRGHRHRRGGDVCYLRHDDD